MGLLDKLKSASGIGLNDSEAYRRAFEKGVLLRNYPAASEMFQKAALKFQEAGNPEMYNRSMANSHLYSFLSTKDLKQARPAMRFLREIDQIEELGSKSEMASARELEGELSARMHESAAEAAQARDDFAAAVELHARASDAFAEILNVRFRTYQHLPAGDGKSTPEERMHIHRGWHHYFSGIEAQWSDPVQASEEYSKTLEAFDRARMPSEFLERFLALRKSITAKRTCWVCGRETQGEDIHYEYLPTTVTPYLRNLIQIRNEDDAMIHREGDKLAVCVACADLVRFLAEEIAEQRVQELREEMDETLNRLSSTIQSLTSRVNLLETKAHRH